MLTCDPKWQFQPPPNGAYHHREIPREALWEFDSLIGKVATQASRRGMLEPFTGAFSRAAGRSHLVSSSEHRVTTAMKGGDPMLAGGLAFCFVPSTPLTCVVGQLCVSLVWGYRPSERPR
jgi:hypothetical protein